MITLRLRRFLRNAQMTAASAEQNAGDCSVRKISMANPVFIGAPTGGVRALKLMPPSWRRAVNG
jgi:hypothetical protein